MDEHPWIPMLATVIITGMIVWVILEWRRLRHKAGLQNKLIDKFSTGTELNDFLQSSGGGKFINFLTLGGSGPKEKLLSSITKGIILTFLGIALLFIGPFLQETIKEVRGFQAFGIAAVAIGIAFLVSTFISYKLSKKWGIIEDTN
ncbi:MAG: hypothetical protein GY950_18695 [bacterium]|nr:hypothetical protein [bacterium]